MTVMCRVLDVQHNGMSLKEAWEENKSSLGAEAEDDRDTSNLLALWRMGCGKKTCHHSRGLQEKQ